MGRFVLFFSTLFLMLAFLPETVFANLQQDNFLDSIVLEYKTKAAVWAPVIRQHAIRLFWLLAILELTWTGIKLALNQSDATEVIGEMTRQVLFIGFGYNLLFFSRDWAIAIIDSFRSIADQASLVGGGSIGISPTRIFEIGLKLAYKVWEARSILSIGDTLGLIFSAIVILFCFSLIAALLLLALVETYIVINCGIILMAFWGSKFTSDIAQKFFIYTLSVGIKLFVMQLLVGLADGMMSSWLVQFEADNLQSMLMMGVSVVLIVLIWEIPNIVSSLVNGSSFISGESIMRTASNAAGNFAGRTAYNAVSKTLSKASQLSKLAGAKGLAGMAGAASILRGVGGFSGFSNTPTSNSATAISGVSNLLKPPLTGTPKLLPPGFSQNGDGGGGFSPNNPNKKGGK